jgi:hypothetical protein
MCRPLDQSKSVNFSIFTDTALQYYFPFNISRYYQQRWLNALRQFFFIKPYQYL